MKAEHAVQIAPSKSTDRILDVDILRGFALLGVILVNIFYFHVPAEFFSSYYEQFSDLLNRGALYVVNWFFTGKFYPIFSFLFGLGFSIQFLKAKQKDINPYIFLARRLGILLLFGPARIIFFWEEGILFIYAVFGFVLLMLTEQTPRFNLAAALLLYFASPAFDILSNFYKISADVPASFDQCLCRFLWQRVLLANSSRTCHDLFSEIQSTRRNRFIIESSGVLPHGTLRRQEKLHCHI